MVRLINALLGAASAVLFVIHAVSMGLFLAGYLAYSPTRKYWGYALLVCVILHGVISLMLAVFDSGSKQQARYWKMNRSTYAQRVLGLLSAVLIYLHMGAYGDVNSAGVYVLKAPGLPTLAAEVLLALVVGAHILLSLPKAAITLGMLETPEQMKGRYNGIYTVFFFTEALALYGLFRYFLG